MRWFRKSSNPPRLLSLSPLKYDASPHLEEYFEPPRALGVGHRREESVQNDSSLHHRSRIGRYGRG